MILFKTQAGQQAFKDRSIPLTPRQRSAFILCDGKRTVEEILEAGVGREDIEQMLELGVLGDGGAGEVFAPGNPAAARGAPGVPTTSAPVARSAQQRYQDAYPIATRLTAALGLRGFRLNLSVEGTSSFEELLALAPKIRAAVGPEKAAALDRALTD